MTARSQFSLVATLPQHWQTLVANHIASTEIVRAWFETDLTAELRYARGLALLTDTRIVYLVEEVGADVNAVDHEGNTAVHLAASRGDNASIEYLVSKGRTDADVASLFASLLDAEVSGDADVSGDAGVPG